ncbi:hypothetical protein HOY80DRAFT_1136725 [Tuber brumale]|nr:hypothetical protein HOY80DRAFT_1136725 [Tuber brumale]
MHYMDCQKLRFSIFVRSYEVLGRALAETRISLSTCRVFTWTIVKLLFSIGFKSMSLQDKNTITGPTIESMVPMTIPTMISHSKTPTISKQRSHNVSPMLFETGLDTVKTPLPDSTLLKAIRTYDMDMLNAFSEKSSNQNTVAEACEQKPEGLWRKLKRLTTDTEKAHLMLHSISDPTPHLIYGFAMTHNTGRVSRPESCASDCSHPYAGRTAQVPTAPALAPAAPIHSSPPQNPSRSSSVGALDPNLPLLKEMYSHITSNLATNRDVFPRLWDADLRNL